MELLVVMLLELLVVVDGTSGGDAGVVEVSRCELME